MQPAPTALDVITAALKRLGAIAGVETPSADLAVDGLDRLNGLLETWLTESLVVYARTRTVQPMTVGKASYSIGIGTPPADIVLPRPEWIYGVGIEWAAAVPVAEWALTPLSEAEYVALTPKTMTSTLPDRYYYNPTYPLGTLFPWPILNSGSAALVLYLPTPLPTGLTLTTVLDLPPGYYRAIRDNLAVELAPEVGRQIDPVIFQAAVDAKAAIQRVNFRPRELHIDPALVSGEHGGYNWQSDE